jgi:hypothetical protein
MIRKTLILLIIINIVILQNTSAIPYEEERPECGHGIEMFFDWMSNIIISIPSYCKKTFAAMHIFFCYFQEQKNQKLFDAIENNDLKAVQEAIALGAELNTLSNDNLTPLHYAANKGNSTITKCLINHGSSIDIQDQVGMTPLHYATRSNLETVKTLIYYGANNAIVSLSGNTAYDYACRLHTHNPIITFLDNVQNYYKYGKQVTKNDQNSSTTPNYFLLRIIKENKGINLQPLFDEKYEEHMNICNFIYNKQIRKNSLHSL